MQLNLSITQPVNTTSASQSQIYGTYVSYLPDDIPDGTWGSQWRDDWESFDYDAALRTADADETDYWEDIDEDGTSREWYFTWTFAEDSISWATADDVYENYFTLTATMSCGYTSYTDGDIDPTHRNYDADVWWDGMDQFNTYSDVVDITGSYADNDHRMIRVRKAAGYEITSDFDTDYWLDFDEIAATDIPYRMEITCNIWPCLSKVSDKRETTYWHTITNTASVFTQDMNFTGSRDPWFPDSANRATGYLQMNVTTDTLIPKRGRYLARARATTPDVVYATNASSEHAYKHYKLGDAFKLVDDRHYTRMFESMNAYYPHKWLYTFTATTDQNSPSLVSSATFYKVTVTATGNMNVSQVSTVSTRTRSMWTTGVPDLRPYIYWTTATIMQPGSYNWNNGKVAVWWGLGGNVGGDVYPNSYNQARDISVGFVFAQHINSTSSVYATAINNTPIRYDEAVSLKRISRSQTTDWYNNGTVITTFPYWSSFNSTYMLSSLYSGHYLTTALITKSAFNVGANTTTIPMLAWNSGITAASGTFSYYSRLSTQQPYPTYEGAVASSISWEPTYSTASTYGHIADIAGIQSFTRQRFNTHYYNFASETYNAWMTTTVAPTQYTRGQTFESWMSRTEYSFATTTDNNPIMYAYDIAREDLYTNYEQQYEKMDPFARSPLYTISRSETVFDRVSFYNTMTAYWIWTGDNQSRNISETTTTGNGGLVNMPIAGLYTATWRSYLSNTGYSSGAYRSAYCVRRDVTYGFRTTNSIFTLASFLAKDDITQTTSWYR